MQPRLSTMPRVPASGDLIFIINQRILLAHNCFSHLCNHINDLMYIRYYIVHLRKTFVRKTGGGGRGGYPDDD